MARIVVIEDDQSLAELYQHILVGAGHDVLTAHNGQEGLDKAKIFKPEIIISDFVMPKKSGIEVFLEIKKKLNSQKLQTASDYQSYAG